jgi:transposase-like protein
MRTFSKTNPNKFVILQRMATDPDMTAADAARTYDVSRHTVEKWCRESGIDLRGNKFPSVKFILIGQHRKRKRLLADLAATEKFIRELEQENPDAKYTKRKKAKVVQK